MRLENGPTASSTGIGGQYEYIARATLLAVVCIVDIYDGCKVLPKQAQ